METSTRKKQILALNIKDVKDAKAEYNKYVRGDMLMNVRRYSDREYRCIYHTYEGSKK